MYSISTFCLLLFISIISCQYTSSPADECLYKSYNPINPAGLAETCINCNFIGVCRYCKSSGLCVYDAKSAPTPDPFPKLHACEEYAPADCSGDLPIPDTQYIDPCYDITNDKYLDCVNGKLEPNIFCGVCALGSLHPDVFTCMSSVDNFQSAPLSEYGNSCPPEYWDATCNSQLNSFDFCPNFNNSYTNQNQTRHHDSNNNDSPNDQTKIIVTISCVTGFGFVITIVLLYRWKRKQLSIKDNLSTQFSQLPEYN